MVRQSKNEIVMLAALREQPLTLFMRMLVQEWLWLFEAVAVTTSCCFFLQLVRCAQGADGSAYLEMGQTKIIAIVKGPREVTRKYVSV